MFELCCAKPAFQEYSITHYPKPICFDEQMEEIIKNILWYVPNIDSYQAPKNHLIGDALYDSFSFTFIMEKMGIDEDKDILWIEPRGAVDESYWDYYNNKICTNCQKLIITRCKSLSKTNDLLRCIRNCVAHGHFSVVENNLIGFNVDTSRNKPDGVKKAIIKIKPDLLLNALRSLTSPQGKELLVGFALERIGYRVSYGLETQTSDGQRMICDLVAQKGDKKYIVEVKDYRGTRYVRKADIARFAYEAGRHFPGYEQALFIDASHVNKEVKDWADDIEGFRIIDMNQIKLLLSEGQDILDQGLTQQNDGE